MLNILVNISILKTEKASNELYNMKKRFKGVININGKRGRI